MEACNANNHNQACILIKDYRKAKLSQEGRIRLVRRIEDGGISLSDMVCSDKEKKTGRVSFFEGLLTLPNGHLAVEEVLNTLIENTDSGEIKIRLGSRRLYRFRKETIILEGLLKMRTQSQGKGSAAQDAVNGVLTHPVMEALIRQKWHSNRFIFIGHSRLWFLFIIAFSCYLRLEINTQKIRNKFYDKQKQWNEDFKQWNESRTSDIKPWDESIASDIKLTNGRFASKLYPIVIGKQNGSRCITIFSRTERGEDPYRNLTTGEATQPLNCSSDVKICHPQHDDGLLHDSSRIVFLFLLVLSATFFFILLVKALRDKNGFRNWFNLFIAGIVSGMMVICYHSDGQNLKLCPATPFLDFDDGFIFVEVILLLLALYFALAFFNVIVTGLSWSNWAQTTDPSYSFQLVSSLSAIVALIGKCHLTTGKDSDGQGPATAAGAIGITLAYLCLILKHGRYSFTAVGNFATMFHIILKKLRYYLVVAFVLLFGFSFGFWVIEQHERKEDDARFKGFIPSIQACFVMFFGGFEDYSDVLKFDEEIESGHHLTLVAFYILYLTMIIVTTLGMLNILLAAIISDFNKNMKDVHTENLLFMAQYSVVLEKGFGSKVRNLLVNWMEVTSLESWGRLDGNIETYTYCTLDLCNKKDHKTIHIHPEEEFRNIILKSE